MTPDEQLADLRAMVKPLEWVLADWNLLPSTYMEAKIPFSTPYSVSWGWENGQYHLVGDNIDAWFPTIGDAQAAAQADYAARILSAVPDLLDEVARLREALGAELSYWSAEAAKDWERQRVDEIAMDYPMPRKMTLAMKKHDELHRLLKRTALGGAHD